MNEAYARLLRELTSAIRLRELSAATLDGIARPPELLGVSHMAVADRVEKLARAIASLADADKSAALGGSIQ